jgi:hypothetical protein
VISAVITAHKNPNSIANALSKSKKKRKLNISNKSLLSSKGN